LKFIILNACFKGTLVSLCFFISWSLQLGWVISQFYRMFPVSYFIENIIVACVAIRSLWLMDTLLQPARCFCLLPGLSS
jgi:hypothetical protein